MTGTGHASEHLLAADRHLAAARDAVADRLRVRHEIGQRGHRELTAGQRAADTVAAALGSWRFLIAQTVFLGAWFVLNVVGWTHHWDPYPFILLNLMLSFQAAYSAPIMLMSANRQADVDRARAGDDYLVNQRAEADVEQLLQLMHAQLAQSREALDMLGDLVADRPGPGSGR